MTRLSHLMGSLTWRPATPQCRPATRRVGASVPFAGGGEPATLGEAEEKDQLTFSLREKAMAAFWHTGADGTPLCAAVRFLYIDIYSRVLK